MSDDFPRAPFDRLTDEELRELIDAGLVEETTQMVDGREQTVYRINPEHRDEIAAHFADE